MSQDPGLLQQIATLAGAINRHKNAQENSRGGLTTRGNRGSFGTRSRYSNHNIRNTYSSGGSYSYPTRGSINRGGITRGSYGPYGSRGSGSRGSTRSRYSIRNHGPRGGSINKHNSINNTINNTNQITGIPGNKIVEIAGVKYKSSQGGTKLTKISDVELANLDKIIPKKALINGIPYVRNESGDLLKTTINSSSAKSTRPCALFTKKGMCRYLKEISNNSGVCPRGNSCRFVHDPKHVAICKRFLKDKCNYEGCKLSHQPTEHNSPLCLYYQKGLCSKDNCKYSHMDVNPSAGICQQFALKRYCELGPKCKALHVFNCPYFDKTGTCPKGDKCSLKHVRRVKEETVKEGGKEEKKDSNTIDYGLLNDLLESDSEGDGDGEDDEEEEDMEDEEEDEDIDQDIDQDTDLDELENIIVDVNSTIDDDFVSI